jgi:hypothetical protein
VGPRGNRHASKHGKRASPRCRRASQFADVLTPHNVSRLMGRMPSSSATLSEKRGFLNLTTGIPAAQMVFWTGYPDRVLILIAAVCIRAGQRLAEAELAVTFSCLLVDGNAN